MGTLRTRLAEAAPDLHAALERSWKIALDEWLPAIPPSADSSNSYPHLRNIERHLDQLLLDAESQSPPLIRQTLRPVETYILLASVLFHDIGRAKQSENHAVISEADIIHRYGNLGVPSLELANCIASVSLGHDAPSTWRPSNLYDVVIDPYGEVRQRALRALLVLADHMDGSHNRAIPSYLKSNDNLAIIGLFRRHVRGVYADCQSQMVRVVLSEMKSWKDTRDRQRRQGHGQANPHDYVAHYHFKRPSENKSTLKQYGFGKKLLDEILVHDFQTKMATLEHDDAHSRSFLGLKKNVAKRLNSETSWIVDFLRNRCVAPSKGLGSPVQKAIHRWCEERFPGFQESSLFMSLWRFLSGTGTARHSLVHPWAPTPSYRPLFRILTLPDWMIVMNLLDVNIKSKKSLPFYGEERPWPHPALLAVLLRDAGANQRELERIRGDLAAFGIPLCAWVLEHREHLYTPFGLETHEPIFNEDFLKRVAAAMWALSFGVFGCSRFTYEELASQACEPNVTRIRQAVRRLAIIERCEFFEASATLPDTPRDGDAIWAGQAHWRWNEPLKPARRCKHCTEITKPKGCPRYSPIHVKPRAWDSGLTYLFALIGQLQPPAP